jgi:hypothetical protein
MSSISRFAVGCLAFIVAAGFARPVLAQQQLGAIQGTIVDQSKAVMPGVTVTVTNLDTGLVRTTITNETGVYRVPSLDPGRYKVTAELQGFRQAAQNEVIVSVGATLGVNFNLVAGTINEAIEVRGVTPDIQTEKADISAVVEQKKINDLPLVGRNVLSLAALQPGINGLGSRQDFLAPEQGMNVTANGVRQSGNSASIDGSSIDGGPWGGTILLVPNVEAVQEYQVIANNPSAEFGRNAGATVSVITKGGTNNVSGSVFEFHRNEGLRARGFFENPNVPKAKFERNDFGGSIGGPVRRDHSFFFFSTEIVRELTGNSFNATVETEQLVNFVNATRPNSIAAQLFRLYAPPSYPTTGLQDLGSPLPGANTWSTTPDGILDVGTIPVTTSGPRDGEQINFRYDQVLRGGLDRIRGTYYLSNITTWNLYTRSAFDKPFPFRNQMLGLAHTWMISSQTLNEATFGIGRQHGEADNAAPDSPDIGPGSGVARFGTEFWHPIDFTQNNFNFKNTLTLNRGRHSFRTGGEFRHGRDGATLHHWERPQYSFQHILDFVDDEVFTEDRAVNPLTGEPTDAYGLYVTNEWALFFQDNWKVRPNLTLNLGLRYDNFGNPSKVDLPYNGIILGPGNTKQEQVAAARVGTIDKIYDTDWNNFAPRLGATWDPTSSGRFVVRAGFGKTYNRINNTVFTDERLNPPQFAHAFGSVQDGTPIVYSLGPNFTPNAALGRGLDANGGIVGARVELRVVDPSLEMPEYYNWFSGVQYQLPANFVVEANYNGTAGRNLLLGDGPTSIDYNRFANDLGDGVRNRLNPSFASVFLNESLAYSNYHGVTLQLQRRYSRGLAFQAAYTFGKWKDVPGNPMEVTDLDLDYGHSGEDVRHKVALNAVWEIPVSFDNRGLNAALGGWQVNAIALMQTGTPFTVICTLAYPRCDFNGDGQNNDRVNLPSFGTDLGDPSQEEWLAGVFTAADFTNPPLGSVADQPRNAFRGPGFKNVDLSLFKNVSMPGFSGRGSTFQIRIEAFNVFNWVNLNNPNTTVNNANIGTVTATRGNNDTGGPRVVQLGFKWMF